MADPAGGVPRRRLILFAKAPVAGTVKTRLSPPLSAEQAARLAAAFLLDEVAAFAAIPGVAIEVACSPPDSLPHFRQLLGDPGPAELFPQVDGDLGQRLAAAFAASCRGTLPIAIAGSDTPDLPPAWVEQAFAALEAGRHDLVLGPAIDGGYNLIAARQCYAALFRGIPWSTDRALEATLQHAKEQALRVLLLPPWEDVDTFAALVRLRDRLAVEPARAPATWRLIANLSDRARD
jgi:rSAM/selenodomain-associated transferase 1